jgi:uncharacterized surface protein with fasciclin (FAS1) repeats
LNRSANFTVLAPTNAAFAKMNNSTLANLENNSTALKRLPKYHIVKSRVRAINFTGKGTLKTLAGVTLPYTVNNIQRTVQFLFEMHPSDWVVFASTTNTTTQQADEFWKRMAHVSLAD